MKLLQFNETPKTPSSKKEEAKNVNWIISFAVAGIKGIIIEAATHEVHEDIIYFYQAKEKVACAMFNCKDVLCVFREGSVFTKKIIPKKR